MRVDLFQELVQRWRADDGGTYRTWFLWEERLKNFRSIRRGIAEVVAEIEGGRFGTAYKGSSLEVVVRAIAEQRQIFKGADHAFLWKPKLRIPDIYESRPNQLAFGRFLQAAPAAPTRRAWSGPSAASTPSASRGSGPPPRTCSTSCTRPSRSPSTPPS